MLTRHVWTWLALVLIAAFAADLYSADGDEKAQSKKDDKSSESKSAKKKKTEKKSTEKRKKKRSEAGSAKKSSGRRPWRGSSGSTDSARSEIQNPVTVYGKIVTTESGGTTRRKASTQYVLKAGGQEYVLKGRRLPQLRTELAQNRDATFQVEGRATRTSGGVSLLIHSFRLAPEKVTVPEKKEDLKKGHVEKGDEKGTTKDEGEDKTEDTKSEEAKEESKEETKADEE